MAFYRSDPAMSTRLKKLLDRLAKEGRPGLHNSIAINWVKYEKPNPSPCSGIGTGWAEERLLYPASVVKLIYAVATESWLQNDVIPDSTELRRALKDMIADSSNDATGLIIDLLTGTTSGPSLAGESWQAWQTQRQVINRWLESLRWPELANINCCQKTWSEGPYGRERDFYRDNNINRNSLSTLAIARILEAVMTDDIISPRACKRLRALLSRSLDLGQRAAEPNNQVDGFLGEGLQKGTRLWSKAGWMSQARHDAAWIAPPNENPMLLVVFCHGRQSANDSSLLPAIANALTNIQEELD